MFFPEVTYGFVPKDATSVFCELFARDSSNSGTVSTLTLTLTGIPRDRMLMLSNVTVDSIPGAGQSAVAILVEIVTHAELQYPIVRERFPVAVAVPVTLNWQGQVFVLGRGEGNNSVFVTVSFDAGTNANTARAGFSGVIVPRGNIAVF